jgi:hypothetical protein
MSLHVNREGRPSPGIFVHGHPATGKNATGDKSIDQRQNQQTLAAQTQSAQEESMENGMVHACPYSHTSSTHRLCGACSASAHDNTRCDAHEAGRKRLELATRNSMSIAAEHAAE